MYAHNRSPQKATSRDHVVDDPAICLIGPRLGYLGKHLKWYLSHPGLPRIGLSHVLDAAEEHIAGPLRERGHTTEAKTFGEFLLRVHDLIRCASSPSDDIVWQNALSELYGYTVKLQIDTAAQPPAESENDASSRLKDLNLKDVEEEIILAIGTQTFISKQIAHKIDRSPDDSAVRTNLSALRNTRKILGNARPGYFIRDEYQWLLQELERERGGEGMS